MTRVLLALALLVASRGAAADVGGQPQDEARADLAEIRRLINAGAAKQALQKLEPLRSGSGTTPDPQVALLLGVAHYQADDPAKAV
jgi:hypothetical protein